MQKDFKRFAINLLDTQRATDFFNLIDQNRPRLHDFFAGTVAKTKTLAATEAYCVIIEEKIQSKQYFPFIISQQGRFIGLIDIKNIDWSIPKAEIGYFIDQQFEGKGIISEILAYVIEDIVHKHGFRKLLCRAASTNVGSAKVALNNGFELEGTIRYDYKTTAGELVDLNYYGRVFEI